VSIVKKLVLVVALKKPIGDKTENEILRDAVDAVNDLDIIVMRTLETNEDNSTLEADIQERFEDIIADTHTFIAYDIGDSIRYLVSTDLEPY